MNDKGFILLFLIMLVACFSIVIHAADRSEKIALSCLHRGMSVVTVGGWGGVKACVDTAGAPHPLEERI